MKILLIQRNLLFMSTDYTLFYYLYSNVAVYILSNQHIVVTKGKAYALTGRKNTKMGYR